MKNWLRKYKWETGGLMAGMLLGWSYWYFVGCASGHCAITSSPINSTIYGAIMGALSGSILRKSPTKSDQSTT
jgi:hypothetical protein